MSDVLRGDGVAEVAVVPAFTMLGDAAGVCIDGVCAVPGADEATTTSTATPLTFATLPVTTPAR